MNAKAATESTSKEAELMRKSLRTRITVLFGATIACLLLIMGVVLYFQISNRLVPLTEDFALKIAQGEADSLAGTLQGVISELKGLAEHPVFKTGSREEQRRLLQELHRNLNAGYDLVGYGGLDGAFLASTGAEGNVSDRDYFHAIIHDKAEFAVGEVVVSRATGVPSVTIAHPVYDGQRLQGAIAFSISLDVLSQPVDAIKIGGAGYGFVTDGEGLVLIHPNPDLRLAMTLADSVKLGYSGLDEVGRRMSRHEAGVQRITGPDGVKELVVFTAIPSSPGWHLGIVIPVAQMMADVNYLSRAIFFIALGIVIIALIVSAWVSGTISKPIAEMSAAMEVMSRGDLTARAEVKSRDEVGRIGKSLNAMAEGLTEIVGAITQIVAGTASSSQELSAASEEYVASLEEVAATLNEFAAGIHEVHDNAVEMNETARRVSALSDEGLAKMEGTGASMERIRETSLQSKQVMSDLESSTYEINEVVSLISEIAEQTNLLALNAAIEAARAGEHGRGFAVVADEVRKLAEQTKTSIASINPVVERLRQGMHQAVTVTERTNADVEAGSRALQESREAYGEIASAMRDMLSLIALVTEAMAEIDQGGEELAATVEEQSASMQQIASTAQALAGMADRLNTVVNEFKI